MTHTTPRATTTFLHPADILTPVSQRAHSTAIPRTTTTPTNPDPATELPINHPRPPIGSKYAPTTPTQPRRQDPSSHLGTQSFHTPSTSDSAVNRPLPLSPPTILSTPPSSFPTRRQHSVAIHPLSPTESPFHDRHSIVVEEVDEDPFEFQHYSGGARRQRTIEGYKFAHLSPTSPAGRMEFGDMLHDTRPVSEARRSIYPLGAFNIPASTLDEHPDLQSPVPMPSPAGLPPVKASFRGLFSLSTPRDIVIRLLPAIFVSMAASLVQPYMSIIMGEVFQNFEAYPLDTFTATATDRAILNSKSNSSSIKFTVAGGAALLLNFIKAVLWQMHGEALTARLREAVYAGVQGKKMEWFDLGMGMRVEDGDLNEETIGAAGLMAKFTR
jgi:ATP-binding cassette subfamily B (MDR/TAP) protein 1